MAHQQSIAAERRRELIEKLVSISLYLFALGFIDFQTHTNRGYEHAKCSGENQNHNTAEYCGSIVKFAWDWLHGQGNAEVVLAIFTILLAFFTAGLWFHTRQIAFDAQEDGKRQAKLTRQSLRIARRANKSYKLAIRRQLRAYVHIESIGFSSPNDIHVDKVARTIRYSEVILVVKAVNSGSTPAQNVKFNVSFYLLPKGEDIPADFGYALIPRDRPHGIRVASGFPALGPGRDVTHSTSLTTDEVTSLVRVDEGEIDMFVFGDVSYTDSFKKDRKTEFCVSVQVRQLHDFSPLTFYGPHNKAT